MKRVVVLVGLMLSACERSSSTTSADKQVSADVRAAMTELASYTEQLYAIMRNTNDCDAAAKQLEALVPPFQELGPRMMKIKDRLNALPEADRDRIRHESDDLVNDLKKRFADADVIEQKGKDCEKSSPAFAAVAPKVMFVKKH